MTALCVVSPGALGVRDGRIQLSPKVVEGLANYASSWPGEVCFVVRPAHSLSPSMASFEWPSLSDLPVQVFVTHEPSTALGTMGPDRVTLLPLESDNKHLVDPTSTVLVADYPLRVRWEAARTDPSTTHLQKLRVGFGVGRRAPTIRRMVRDAAGLQCNGPDAFASYAPLSRAPVQYFDTRVTDLEVAEALHMSHPVAPLSLRLAFSGRWIPQKGPLLAVQLASRLLADGHDVALSMFGGGPLEDELRAQAVSQVRFEGRLDFHEEWVPTVTQDVDLMILPHPQSDSASTYLESMSCGAPVVASNNRYWRLFLAMHGAGWGVPPTDLDALVSRVSHLIANPDEIRDARLRGLQWAQEHTFEREFGRRINHLREIAQA